ncbi:MAG: hypothetical protein KatS3mg068_1172 [Candidatus Sericytochromatia bacterium]|nr:MAG: hypothetical protein KatS3mg068_1172 [Candidatus Sericytochromatia bacterium]
MKYFFSLLLSSILVSCSSNLQNNLNLNNNTKVLSLNNKSTTTGDIRYHTIKTTKLKSGQREIVIYLPPSYNSNNNKRYPVLYMHDGQNIFDKYTGAFGKEWYVDEKVDYLIKKKCNRRNNCCWYI